MNVRMRKWQRTSDIQFITNDSSPKCFKSYLKDLVVDSRATVEPIRLALSVPKKSLRIFRQVSPNQDF